MAGWQIACLPGQVRKMRAEIDRMLPGAATDFENTACMRENIAQDGKDGRAIALACCGERWTHGGEQVQWRGFAINTLCSEFSRERSQFSPSSCPSMRSTL